MARVYWADSSVNVLEGRFVEALALASESRAQLANAPDDLVVRIALTETIACVESDQIARAVDWQKNAMATGERFGPIAGLLHRALPRKSSNSAAATSEPPSPT